MSYRTMHRGERPRILIVDDDPIFTSLASACLGAAGNETRSVTDGVEALDILEREKFDLALVDLAMPRIDGLRLISLVRGLPRHDAMIVVVISTSMHAEAYNEAHQLGADAFLTKPVRWALLPTCVRFLLQPRKALASHLLR